MAVKESSDELNPTATTSDEFVTSPPAARSGKDYLALAIATCGVGYLPLAPGTWGSLLAVGIYLVVRIAVLSQPTDTREIVGTSGFLAGEILVIVIVTFGGIWAASRTERVLKVKDPGKVVVDEVAGQFIALLPVPLARVGAWPVFVIMAFLLFRFFDIVKPYPARKLESLHGGLGIMLDDVVAGIYAAVVVALVVVASWYI
uniref:Putative phosphatidyl-glycerophosphatase n=1 Tax=uncultured bacterium 253 TaxID=698385 RepID=E3T729_9BACT|nr:putative phosphatidyl-glycerophosphatase [uncultured bacterium 253]